MSATVSVKLPGPLVWELSKMAEQQGVNVADVISEALASKPVQAQPPDRTLATRARVIELVEAGYDDGRISVELDRVRAYVAEVRRRAGLKPNKARTA